MNQKNKFLIFSSVFVISSFLIYKTFNNHEKIKKQKRYKLLEAILVDPYYD